MVVFIALGGNSLLVRVDESIMTPKKTRPAPAQPRSIFRSVLALLVALAYAAVERVLEAIGPSHCCSCDRPLRSRATFCGACAQTIEPLPATIPNATGEPALIAFGAYGGALAEALRRFKYRDHPELARPLGDLLRRAIRATALPKPLVIVPVPLHPRRLALRGYNQAALLARVLQRELAVPLLPRGLQRTRDTPAQMKLDRRRRLVNLAGAFRVPTPTKLEGKHVVLVDDVTSTGATLAAGAAALVAAGACSVTAVVVARTLELD